jgi:nucleoside-diphosphate-sugar epimerase
VVIVRACSVFGPQDRDFLVYFRLAAKGIVLALKEQSRASLVYVKDLAEALYLCAQTQIPSGEILNIADSRAYAWDELAVAATAALGRRYLKLKLPDGVLHLGSLLLEAGQRLTRRPAVFNRDKYRELAQACWLLDVGKAAAMLSFRTRYPLDQAVRETISWYIAKGWL